MTKRIDYGGGRSLIRRLDISEKAAEEIRRRATILSTRYRKEDANAAANAILEAMADRRILYLSDDIRAALPWLQDARAMCWSEEAQRGLEQLIAGIVVSSDGAVA